MKKLGILTFNRALNYGAILQAFALKRVCENLGYEVHIIDYNKEKNTILNPITVFLHSPLTKSSINRLIRNILSYRWDRKRRDAFMCFRRRYLDESIPCESISQISSLDFDMYVIGSDQIWNYHITGGQFDPVFFGLLPGRAFSIVYGASAQDTPFSEEMERSLYDILLKSEAKISIREHELANYIGDLTGIQYPVVIDPTLLAGRTIMQQVESEWHPSSSYILIYQIERNPKSDITIKTLEKRFGCRVYSMTVPKLGSIHGKKGAVDPGRFLSLLHHARFLVTNSFHGVALAIIYHKQFYVYENFGVMTRIDDLLNSFNLQERRVKYVSDINPDYQIDYTQIDRILEKMQKDSLSFLYDAFQEKTQKLFSEKAN